MKMMISVGLRFCGGCNPEIDRIGVVDRLKDAFAQKGIRAAFVTDKHVPTDLLLLISGCKHACLDEEYVDQDEGTPVLSVRGEMIGDAYVAENDLPDYLSNEILRHFSD
jgi:hypothetical protein